MRALVVLFAVVVAAVAAPHEKRSIGYVGLPSAVSYQSQLVAVQPAVEARAIYAAPSHTVYAGGSAVSHQSRVDVQSSPAVVATAPVYSVAEPTYVAEPVVEVYSAPAAVSHQSRVDVHSSPAVVSEHLVAAPVARSVYAPTFYASAW